MLVPIAAALALSSAANAGSGPWVVSPGDINVYAGTEYQRGCRSGSMSMAIIEYASTSSYRTVVLARFNGCR